MDAIKRFITLAALLILVIAVAGCSTGKGKAGNIAQIPAAQNQPGAPSPEEEIQEETKAPENQSAELTAREDIDEESERQTDRESSSLLEEALACVQEALAAAEKDDMENALAKLDEAYSLLLDIDCPADSSLAQEKSALRILIAQRINQVYAWRLAPLPTANNSIPLVENQWVEKEIKLFQTGERKVFIEGYKHSGLYRQMITEELKKAGLPEELSWVPMIESWFKPRALSRARALGMWQFIRSTGYRYGLKQDRYVDERMDPIKSTRAAIRFLTELHKLFGDWTTALAAYNCGEMNVLRAIRAQKIDYLDNFWDLFNNLPYETARYVPRFIAAMLIMSDPAKYGFELPEPDPPLCFDTLSINLPAKLSSIAQKTGLETSLLIALNPELRHDSTPNYPYELRVPAGSTEKCLSVVDSLPKYVPPEVVFQGWYTVRRGDTLGAIARRYRTTVSAIARLNNLRNTRLIRPGQRLRIPGVPTGGSLSQAPVNAADGQVITYTVVQGDTLFEIARRYRTTVEKIKNDNGLTGEMISIGNKLTIHVGRTGD